MFLCDHDNIYKMVFAFRYTVIIEMSQWNLNILVQFFFYLNYYKKINKKNITLLSVINSIPHLASHERIVNHHCYTTAFKMQWCSTTTIIWLYFTYFVPRSSLLYIFSTTFSLKGSLGVLEYGAQYCLASWRRVKCKRCYITCVKKKLFSLMSISGAYYVHFNYSDTYKTHMCDHIRLNLLHCRSRAPLLDRWWTHDGPEKE